MRSKGKSKLYKWQEMSLINSFAPFVPAVTFYPGYMVDELGFVHLRGGVITVIDGGDWFVQMPPIYRPEKHWYNATICNDGAVSLGTTSTRLYVDASSGKIRCPTISSPAAWINLGGVYWHIGKDKLRFL